MNSERTGETISNQIIDDSFMYDNLEKIFPSSIILKSNFEILSVSREVEKLLNYQRDELVGKPIKILLEGLYIDIKKYSEELFSKGYFKSTPFTAFERYGQEIYIEASGFYLGLVSDLNDLIVLNIIDLRSLKIYKQQLQNRDSEFNELVYRTYHDIKGPLATIKGLINIGNKDLSREELKNIIKMIEDTTLLLDYRINNISRFFDLTTIKNTNNHLIDLGQIEKEIKKLLDSKNEFKDVKFRIQASDIASMYINGDYVLKIILNYVEAVVNLRARDEDPMIHISLSKANSYLKIEFSHYSIEFYEELKQRLMDGNYSIQSAINDEACLRFYINKNYITRIGGKLKFYFENKSTKTVMLIPLDFEFK